MTRISGVNAYLLLVVFLIPVIDFPLPGNSYIKPLAMVLAVPVGLLLIIQNRLKLPTSIEAKLLYILSAWVFIGAFTQPLIYGVPDVVRGNNLHSREVRDVVSYFIAIFFWLTIRHIHKSFPDWRQQRKVITYSTVLTIIAGFIQASVCYWDSDVGRNLDSLFMLFRNRQNEGYAKIFGLTPEGSMLADQIVTFFGPLVISAIICNGFNARRGLILSMLCLLLIFTQSRIGVIGAIFLLVTAQVLSKSSRHSGLGSIISKSFIAFMLPTVIIIAVIMLSSKVSYVDAFISTFKSAEKSAESGVWSNVTRAGCQIAALKMFIAYPFGVGTGAFPFLFEQFVPDWALISPEIHAYLGGDVPEWLKGDLDSRLADPKAYLMRIAAELGLVGLTLVASIYFIIIKKSFYNFTNSTDSAEKQKALFCLLSLIAMIPMSFNSNSYVWPHWIYVYSLVESMKRC